jgi:hypothetical protein
MQCKPLPTAGGGRGEEEGGRRQANGSAGGSGRAREHQQMDTWKYYDAPHAMRSSLSLSSGLISWVLHALGAS